MNYFGAVADGLIAAFICGMVTYRKKEIKAPYYSICMIGSIIHTWLLYRGQENSDYFFFHPYVTWLIMDIIVLIIEIKDIHEKRLQRKKLVERLILWPALVIPIISGFELSIGWLLKLYVR